MQHFYGLQAVSLKNAWLTIGSFDGFHRGHQQIIKHLTAGAHANNAPAVVLTFYPHPAMVLRGPQESFYLSTPEEKAALLHAAGVDVVITHPFNHQVAQRRAAEFMQEIHDHLQLTQLLIGHDFALGRQREGDLPTLTRLGAEFGFDVEVITALEQTGEVISSSRIRRLLENGEIDQAAALLGHTYAVQGTVIVGDGRGRTIGIPTANLDVLKERVVPAAGVYACLAEIDGQIHQAVTNVGVRPTFETEPVAPRIEAHLLDFEGDLYQQQLKLTFLARLRNEQRFSGVDALVAQIHADIAQARQLFAEEVKP